MSNAIVRSLQEAGHEVLRLRDHLPIESADPTVSAKAQDLEALLLSLNGDFADLVTYPPAKYQKLLVVEVHRIRVRS